MDQIGKLSNPLNYEVWPPTQKTRNFEIEDVFARLALPSRLTKKSGCFSTDEAAAIAKAIEEESFSATTASAQSYPQTKNRLWLSYILGINSRMFEAVRAKEVNKFDDQRSDMAVIEEAQIDDQRSDLPDKDEPQIVDQRKDLKNMEEAKEFVDFVLGEGARRFETVDLIHIIEKSDGTLSSDEAATTAIKLEEKAFSLTVASVYEDDEIRGQDIFRVYWKEIDQIISDFKNYQSVVNATSLSSPSDPSDSSPSKWSLESYLDRPIPSVIWRWLVAIALSGYFILRISYLRHIVGVCYIFGMLLIVRVGVFLSPVNYSDYSHGASKVSSADYKPFVRRFSEFKFWVHVMLCLCICITMTFVDFFHNPMHWFPPSVIWVFSCYVFLRTPIMGMIKYKYVPFNIRKPAYGKKPA